MRGEHHHTDESPGYFEEKEEAECGHAYPQTQLDLMALKSAPLITATALASKPHGMPPSNRHGRTDDGGDFGQLPAINAHRKQA